MLDIPTFHVLKILDNNTFVCPAPKFVFHTSMRYYDYISGISCTPM